MSQVIDPNGLSIGICTGNGWVTVELNGYGSGHSRKEVIDACVKCLQSVYGEHRRWKPIITESDRVIFENVK